MNGSIDVSGGYSSRFSAAKIGSKPKDEPLDANIVQDRRFDYEMKGGSCLNCFFVLHHRHAIYP